MFLARLYWKYAIFDGGVARWWGNFATNGYPWFVTYYAISAEFVGAFMPIPGLYARWAALYAIPLIIGAAHFWLVRKGFYFTAGGAELPIIWGVILIVQALLGDGPWAVKSSALPWRQRILA
jgi:putative oxidoreductase